MMKEAELMLLWIGCDDMMAKRDFGIITVSYAYYYYYYWTLRWRWNILSPSPVGPEIGVKENRRETMTMIPISPCELTTHIVVCRRRDR